MSLLTNNLLSNMVTIKTAAIENSSLFKQGVIEAVVLSSSPLLIDGKTVKGQYQVILQNNKPTQTAHNTTHQNQNQISKATTLEIISKQALVKGNTIQLQINTDSTAKIISITDSQGRLVSGIKASGSNPQLATNPPVQTATSHTARPHLSKDSADHIQSSAKQIPATPEKIIADSLRQALPLQQPLKLLIPLLRQLNSPAANELPKDIGQQLQRLLAIIPSAEQAQTPKTLKRALLNSGAFLESKLSHIATDLLKRQSHQSKLSSEQLDKLPTMEQLKRRDAAIIHSDTKAITQKLVQQIERHLGKPVSTSTKQDAPSLGEQLDPALLKNLNQTATQQTSSAATSNSSDQDIILQQLGRQLLASLAKTQINQLETLNQRGQQSNELTTQNTWTLELPIQNGKHTDNMGLHIQEESCDGDKLAHTKQWRVMLNFDLHKLGKLSVELVIINKSVSATIWSELEYAHQQVQNEVETFKNGLKKIGVNVSKIECLIGLPAQRSQNLSPLVDIRT